MRQIIVYTDIQRHYVVDTYRCNDDADVKYRILPIMSQSFVCICPHRSVHIEPWSKESVPMDGENEILDLSTSS